MVIETLSRRIPRFEMKLVMPDPWSPSLHQMPFAGRQQPFAVPQRRTTVTPDGTLYVQFASSLIGVPIHTPARHFRHPPLMLLHP
jgi:hypothetical protein